MSTIQLKAGKCIDCDDEAAESILMAKRCFGGPHFHYQKHQQSKYAIKQKAKASIRSRKTSYEDKTLPQLLLLAQKHFNAYIRARDSKADHFICISCGQYRGLSKLQAGHYLSSGHHSYHRFNEKNVHGQCMACNCHLSGNLINYRISLVKKIGAEEVEKLENARSTSHKWDKFEVIGVIEKYKELIKTL